MTLNAGEASIPNSCETLGGRNSSQQNLRDAAYNRRQEWRVEPTPMLLGLCNPRLTTLKPNSLRFAGAERNRRELTSSDNIGKIRFTFSSQFLFVICRDSSPFA